MSISTELSRLTSAKSDLKTAIEDKGVTVGGATLDAYAGYVGQITGGGGTYQSKTVTPSASQQSVTPDMGYDALSAVTVNGDADLVAGNIKSGVQIFGVTGTLESGGGGTTVYTITKANYADYLHISEHGVQGDTIYFIKNYNYSVVSIKDASDNTISYSLDMDSGGSGFYFTMPSSNVTITLYYNDF